MKSIYVNMKQGVPLTLTLQDGAMVNFPAGKLVTEDARLAGLLDRHPNYGRTFVREHRPATAQAEPAAPELKPIDEVTTSQQAAQWLADHLQLTGITSKAKAHKAAAEHGYAFPHLI
jgi:hypothetical protein